MGTGTKRDADSVTGVWYDPSVGGEDGDDKGEGDEAYCGGVRKAVRNDQT